MTEHSTAELRHQWDQATGRREQAARAEREARDRYHAALAADEVAALASQGMTVGSKVRAFCGRKPMGEFFLMGAEVQYGYVKAVLHKLKKDGTPHANPVFVPHDRLEPVAEAGQ